MISTGAAFAIALTALIVGIIIGGLAREHINTTGGHEGDENPGYPRQWDETTGYQRQAALEALRPSTFEVRDQYGAELDEAIGRLARDIAAHRWAELDEAASDAYRGAHVFDREAE